MSNIKCINICKNLNFLYFVIINLNFFIGVIKLYMFFLYLKILNVSQLKSIFISNKLKDGRR